MKALDRQVGGEYYKCFNIQPYEFFLANKVPHHKAAIIRRIVRYDSGGRDPLKELGKIVHECDIILELWDTNLYRKIKETVKQKTEKISLEEFLNQDCLNKFKKYVIRKIYKYDTLDCRGKDDIRSIRSLALRIMLSL